MNKYTYIVIDKESANILYAGDSYSVASCELIDNARCEIWMYGEKIGEISGQHNTNSNWENFR